MVLRSRDCVPGGLSSASFAPPTPHAFHPRSRSLARPFLFVLSPVDKVERIGAN
ncbi:RNA binding protein (ISS) [Anopheles sinensis]|uniref:RNA binding protein (ISS) n=1 Tax=Anopheles sinensis TaxID=74873 RepID=A0A084VH40_ANOSI|nr:RNA binding protein (ISS) [Anopheles sinensis]